ncbi:oxidoreductase [Pyrus ussuriensis x Pyrus communis]|uniref:Oxidoreductase n=1 Tax=Pyrus ussuriensis x Pyrus communis TaxID=2448454 RepID=A0A5N5FY98_9ROSA|nr:oxidoreductase [Pyrus ussuriensis x Pyrus communis]
MALRLVIAADRKRKVAKAAFDASVDGGITFFDTAEVYGSRASFGAVNSETLLGRFIKERKQKDPGVEVVVTTTFDSLNRLELSSVELYQLHWPGIWGNEGYLDGLGDAVEQSLVKAVGVSNYSAIAEAHAKLQKRGIPLASNQVNYSLIHRAPKENGVKSTCDELGITLIAYSPIAQAEVGTSLHTFFYKNPPTGLRRQICTPEFLSKLQSLLKYFLNWLIAQDNVVPIPGTKNAEQAAKFAGALGWRLNSEVAELRALATEIKPVTSFPAEKF